MKSRTLAERFWAKVDKNGPTMPHMESPCWVWTAERMRTGYGKIKTGSLSDGSRRASLAHRIGFVLQGGQITSVRHYVLHRCDNPPCVRGDHLFSGTQTDNVHDMWRKGRAAPMDGEHHPQAKLSAMDVEAIRTIRASGFGTHQEIADMFGVTQPHITNILAGRERR